MRLELDKSLQASTQFPSELNTDRQIGVASPRLGVQNEDIQEELGEDINDINEESRI